MELDAADCTELLYSSVCVKSGFNVLSVTLITFQEQQEQLGLKFEDMDSDDEEDKDLIALKQNLQVEG